MQDKKYIIGAVSVLVFTIVVIVVAFFISTGGTEDEVETVNPFGDTSGTRPIDDLFGDDLFGDFGSEWIGATSSGGATTPAPLFRLLTKEPALAPVIVDGGSDLERTPFVRFVARNTGYIFETPLPHVAEPVALSHETILRMGEVKWSPDGESALLRFLDDINQTIFTILGTFSSPVMPEGTTTPPVSNVETFTSRPLSNNLVYAVFSPDGASVFYLEPTDLGTVGYLESVQSGTRVEVWSSPLQNLTASWTADETIVIYTNPSKDATGVVWTLDPKTWRSTVVFGNHYSLAALMSPLGDQLLYSLQEENDGLQSLRVFDMRTGDVVYLPVATLAEKCVWGGEGSVFVYCGVPRDLRGINYLEKWYQGLHAFDDVIWRFDTKTGAAKRLFDPFEQTQKSFDVIDIAIDPQEKYLVFRNKRDDLLWALQLPQERTEL